MTTEYACLLQADVILCRYFFPMHQIPNKIPTFAKPFFYLNFSYLGFSTKQNQFHLR
jgi:hypothetical protein